MSPSPSPARPHLLAYALPSSRRWLRRRILLSVLAGLALSAAYALSRPRSTPQVPSRAALRPLAISYPKPAYCIPQSSRYALLSKVESPRSWNGLTPAVVLVPPGTTNLARGKPVTSSDNKPVLGTLDQVNDGDKEAADGSWVELAPGVQWVQIDLGRPSTIHAIALWHGWSSYPVYEDVVVQVCDEPTFSVNVRTVFNNDRDNSSGLGRGWDPAYIDSHEGRLIPVPALPARYVRLYSRGNSGDEMSQYAEVEVYGIAGVALTVPPPRRSILNRLLRAG